MRWAALIYIVLLAGCAATEQATYRRGPVNQAEHVEARSLLDWAGPIKDRLVRANFDLCGPGDGRCVVPMTVSVSDGIGAYASQDGIEITTPLLKYLRNEHELAVILGHEQAHRLLGHVNAYRGYDAPQELAADCVGALLAARAGFDPVTGSDTMRRIALAETGEKLVLAVIGVFGGGAKLDWNQRIATIARAAEAGRGRQITKQVIEETCGARL